MNRTTIHHILFGICGMFLIRISLILFINDLFNNDISIYLIFIPITCLITGSYLLFKCYKYFLRKIITRL